MNFPKSVNSFGLAVFFRKFPRPMLVIRAAKSQNELATKALGRNRAWVMAPKIRNSDQQIDILLELRIDHQGQVEAISEHLALRKTPDLPDLRFIQVTRRAVSRRVIPDTGCSTEVGP